MTSKRKARAMVYRAKQAKLRRIETAPTINPAWTAPAVRELAGVEAIIRRAYARFSPDHPMHRHEPNYADDYTSEGARVLTYIKPDAPAPFLRMAA